MLRCTLGAVVLERDEAITIYNTNVVGKSKSHSSGH